MHTFSHPVDLVNCSVNVGLSVFERLSDVVPVFEALKESGRKKGSNIQQKLLFEARDALSYLQWNTVYK